GGEKGDELFEPGGIAGVDVGRGRSSGGGLPPLVGALRLAGEDFLSRLADQDVARTRGARCDHGLLRVLRREGVVCLGGHLRRELHPGRIGRLADRGHLVDPEGLGGLSFQLHTRNQVDGDVVAAHLVCRLLLEKKKTARLQSLRWESPLFSPSTVSTISSYNRSGQTACASTR